MGGKSENWAKTSFSFAGDISFVWKAIISLPWAGGESPDMDQREAQGAWWERELPNAQEMEQARERLAQ